MHLVLDYFALALTLNQEMKFAILAQATEQPFPRNVYASSYNKTEENSDEIQTFKL